MRAVCPKVQCEAPRTKRSSRSPPSPKRARNINCGGLVFRDSYLRSENNSSGIEHPAMDCIKINLTDRYRLCKIPSWFDPRSTLTPYSAQQYADLVDGVV